MIEDLFSEASTALSSCLLLAGSKICKGTFSLCRLCTVQIPDVEMLRLSSLEAVSKMIRQDLHSLIQLPIFSRSQMYNGVVNVTLHILQDYLGWVIQPSQYKTKTRTAQIKSHL